MKLRQRLFQFFAFIALLWIGYGFSLSGSAYNEVAGQTASEAGKAGAAIGAGLGLTFFVCSGLPFLLLFAFLAWRTGVGIRTEQRHQETLAAMRGTGGGGGK